MSVSAAITPLTSYYGGKSKSKAQFIVSRFPAHDFYVEPFFGMGAVLFAKQPSKVEVVNDKHDGLINLFRVIRDDEMCSELLSQLDLTLYSRQEWRECVRGWKTQADPVERARMV